MVHVLRFRIKHQKSSEISILTELPQNSWKCCSLLGGNEVSAMNVYIGNLHTLSLQGMQNTLIRFCHK